MDRLETIQELLSFRVMGSAVFALAALYMICKPPYRLKLFLALAVVTSTLSKLVDMEYPADMAKAFFPLFFGFLIVAALTHPGPRRRMPWYCSGLAVLAVVSFIYIRNVLDFQVAFILRAQWLMITIAGWLVVQTIVDQKSLRYVFEGLVLGLAGGVTLTGSQFIVEPAHAFSMGFGRFSPYGANPNQIGLLFAMTIPVSLYLAVTAKSNVGRAALLACCALAVLQSALTLSRAAMLIAALPSLPILFVLCRHPGVIILGIVCAYVVGSQTLNDLDGFDLEHVTADAVDDRFSHAYDLLQVVEQRPMFGLLFAKFENATHEEINAHNAYVDLLYLGGYSLAVPHFFLFLLGHYSAWLTWINRRGSNFDPLAISMLMMFSACIFLHGFVNGTIMYPTYIWALIHVIVLTFFLANGLRLSMARRNEIAPPMSSAQSNMLGRVDGARPGLRHLPPTGASPGPAPSPGARAPSRHALRPIRPARPRLVEATPRRSSIRRPNPIRPVTQSRKRA